jgi:hypothetical protein
MWYERPVRAGAPVPMVTKVEDVFYEMVTKVEDVFYETFIFLLFVVMKWYTRMVRSDTTVSMVAICTRTCENFNFFAFLHMPLHINISSKMTMEKLVVHKT